MAHTYHAALPGYDERQILHDGCAECEERGQNLMSALAHMDGPTFARAWKRAYDWKASSGDPEAVGPISDTEAVLLQVLWAIQVILQRGGVPLNGKVPAPNRLRGVDDA